MQARDVMTTPAVTVDPGAALTEVMSRLIEHDISAVPVIDRAGTLVGIVTEADLVGKKAYPGSRPRFLRVVADPESDDRPCRHRQDGLTASDVMTPFPIVAHPEDNVERLAQRMLENEVKRLPVVDHGRIVGIVTRHDILRVFDRSETSAAVDVAAEPLRQSGEACVYSG
jgi:CBS domain-containing protein